MFILNNSFLVLDGYKLFNHDESERARVCLNLSVNNLNQKKGNWGVLVDMNVTINQKIIYVTTVVITTETINTSTLCRKLCRKVTGSFMENILFLKHGTFIFFI